MSDEIQILKSRIEELRSDLVRLASEKSLTDEDVVSLSQELDELINTYNRLLRPKR